MVIASFMGRQMRFVLRAILVLSCSPLVDHPAAARDLPGSTLAALVETVISAKTRQVPTACAIATPTSPSGLTVQDGIVTSASVIKEIGGYAGSAKTTGGLGGRLLVVTTTSDYDPGQREAAIAGSLRERLEFARREGNPAWIVFDPALGPEARIALKANLQVPSNVTIDGSCADVTLEAPDTTNIILLFVASGTRNVIITRLAFRKTGYLAELNPKNDSAIRLNGDIDRIAILYNDLFECGDGCIDITVGNNRAPSQSSRITVAYNFIHDHDKVMLFGTWECAAEQCDQEYLKRSRELPPVLSMTLEGNLFLRTGQRHPRIWGLVSAHIVNNVVAFQPLPRPNGKPGTAYGIFVADAARALIEHNVFVAMPPRREPPLAVWTVTSPGAMRMPGSVEGFVRLQDNEVIGGAVAKDNLPQDVPDPPYPYHAYPIEKLTFDKAMACIANRSGRTGANTWSANFCNP